MAFAVSSANSSIDPVASNTTTKVAAYSPRPGIPHTLHGEHLVGTLTDLAITAGEDLDPLPADRRRPPETYIWVEVFADPSGSCP